MNAASALLPPLPPQACIGLVAPAGPPRPGRLEASVLALEQLGFRAKVYPACAGPTVLGHLAASDDARLADLHAAWADPAVDALLCLRGGYGCIRLLERIDAGLVRRAAKPLIGYSDITSLHALYATLGLPAWHAPMPASDWLEPGGWTDATGLAQALRRGVWPGDQQQAPTPHALNQGHRAVGRLLGGNLSVLASCIGTPCMPDLAGAILFLEEIGEDPYRVDRSLSHLQLAGALRGVAGVVLGSFTEAADCSDVLRDRLAPLGVPVLAGWQAGHGQPHRALPLGLPVQLDVAQRSLTWGPSE